MPSVFVCPATTFTSAGKDFDSRWHLTSATSNRQGNFALSGCWAKYIWAACKSFACFFGVIDSRPSASQLPWLRVLTSTKTRGAWSESIGDWRAIMSNSPHRQYQRRCRISHPCACNHWATRCSPSSPISGICLGIAGVRSAENSTDVTCW